MFICCATSVESVVVAFLLYVLFEAPYVNLFKLLAMPKMVKNQMDKGVDKRKVENNNVEDGGTV